MKRHHLEGENMSTEWEKTPKTHVTQGQVIPHTSKKTTDDSGFKATSKGTRRALLKRENPDAEATHEEGLNLNSRRRNTN